MQILITGGLGFIGRHLASHLLREGRFTLDGEKWRPIEKITLLDSIAGGGVEADTRVEVVIGDLSDENVVGRCARDVDCVWHLASVVSSAAEADFDLGMRVNVSGTVKLLEALRAGRSRPRVVFASSIAVFGGTGQSIATDEMAPTPKSSYGAQKAIGELLIGDYSRKGFVDGRSLRLPTIVVRPGSANRAASSFASSLIREPLAGRPVICPVSPDTHIYVSSVRCAVDSLIRGMEIAEDAIDEQRTLSLPGLAVSAGEIVAALERVAGVEASRLVSWEQDSSVQRIVESWPRRIEAVRAERLGFKTETAVDDVIRAYARNRM